MPRSRLLSTLVLASLALTPALGTAQGAPQTHTVKKGDTLWDLAQQYLGDAFKWPEIYRRNTTTVKDPNLIYPDQVLVITGDIPPTPGTPADSAAVSAVDTAAALTDTAVALDTAVVPDTASVDTAGVPVAGAGGEVVPVTPGAMTGSAGRGQRRGGPLPMTIFNPDRYRVTRGTRSSLVLRARASTVRAGDYASAPFLWDGNGVKGAGAVGAVVGPDGVAITRYRRPVQIYEHVFVKVPTTATGEPGERLLTVRYGPSLGRGRVVIPTGVLKLVTAVQNGQAEALLLNKYEDVYAGQPVITADTTTALANSTPARVEFGSLTKVLWVYDEPVIPSIGQHVILAAKEKDGLVPGDQVTLHRDLGKDRKGVPLPPFDLAVLQVTRVTRWGASAIIIGQTDGLIKPGTPGRVTAKMP